MSELSSSATSRICSSMFAPDSMPEARKLSDSCALTLPWSRYSCARALSVITASVRWSILLPPHHVDELRHQHDCLGESVGQLLLRLGVAHCVVSVNLGAQSKYRRRNLSLLRDDTIDPLLRRTLVSEPVRLAKDD